MPTAAELADKLGIDFAAPAGAPAHFAPDSIHWRIYKNPVALGVGGICAVLLEFADPRIRSGVWDHSTYPTDPIGRSERTGLAAMVGVYGTIDDAARVINRVNKMHARVEGHTPGGQAYRALDPELLNWVAATAGYGFLEAYDRFVATVSEADRLEFWAGGGELAAMYGATDYPSSDDDFTVMMNDLAPGFEAHEINDEFLAIVHATDAAGKTPRFVRRAITRASVSLLPPVVRERLELGPEHDLTTFDRLLVTGLARLAERKFDADSAPAQASARLGLPADFLWKKPAERERLLANHPVGVG